MLFIVVFRSFHLFSGIPGSVDTPSWHWNFFSPPGSLFLWRPRGGGRWVCGEHQHLHRAQVRGVGPQELNSGINVPTGKNQDGKKPCDLLFRLWKLVFQRKAEGEVRKTVTLSSLQYFSFLPQIRMKTSLNFPLEWNPLFNHFCQHKPPKIWIKLIPNPASLWLRAPKSSSWLCN